MAHASRTVTLRTGSVAAVIVGIVLCAIALFWDCPHSSPFGCIMSVERLAAVVTTFSLTLAPIMYFVKQRHSDKTESQRVAAALYGELDNALGGLDPDRHPDLRAVDIRGRTIYFMSRLFNHDIYDSLVNSGKITFVDVKLQQDVQDVFQHIKDHNGALVRIRKMEETGRDHSRAYHSYLKLGDSERVLLDSIPAVMSKLKETHSVSTSGAGGAQQDDHRRPHTRS